jgi:hypothetical protein
LTITVEELKKLFASNHPIGFRGPDGKFYAPSLTVHKFDFYTVVELVTVSPNMQRTMEEKVIKS